MIVTGKTVWIFFVMILLFFAGCFKKPPEKIEKDIRQVKTELYNAIRQGELEDAKKILETSPEYMNLTPFLGQAVEEDDVEIAELLIDKGANVNEKDISGYTFLHSSVISGD